MSDTKPDAPPLVEILKRLAMHRDGLYESGYGPVRVCNQLSSLDRGFREALEADDYETASRHLESMVRAAGVQYSSPSQSPKEMHDRLRAVMDARVSTMAAGDPSFDANYADFGPEAAEMCEIWKRLGKEPGSREDREAYWHHPLRRLCEQLEQHLGIPRDDLEKAALRLNSALGLRGMEPFPDPDGTDGDPGLPDWLSMLPKFKALDQDGTTAKHWESLSEAYQDELGELCGDVNPPPTDSTDDTDSAWVTAAILWPEKFLGRKGSKGLDRFREKHPEMFRNPTRYKLEIHAGRWVKYWHEVEQTASDSLGEPPESIADDPDAQTEFLEGAADRMANLRSEKKAGQQ